MSPMHLLAMALGVTAIAWATDALLRRRHKRILRQLARRWEMRYSPHDLFGLARRLTGQADLARARHLRVRDVVYGTRAGRHRYLFTVEYVDAESRLAEPQSRAAACSESVEPDGSPPAQPTLAPADLPLTAQYEHLHALDTAAHPAGASAA